MNAQGALFLAHSVLIQVLTFVLRPAATYRALELAVPGEFLGVVGASFAIVPLMLAVPSGQAVDRFGEKRVMLAGSFVLIGACASFSLLSEGIAGLLLSTVLLGTGHLLSVVGEQALVANRTSAGEFDAAFGRYTFALSLGQMLGPGLIIVIGGSQRLPDTKALFLAASFAAAVTLMVTAGLAQAAALPAGHSRSGNMRSLLQLPGLVRALLVSSVVLAAVDITLVYMPAVGAERGLASGFIGVLLAVRAAASMASRFFLGRMSRAVGRRALMLSSIAMSALAMALLPVRSLPAWILLVAVAMLGLGLGVGQPLTMSWLAESAPPGARGRAMSLRLTGNRLGQVVIPSALGLVAATAGAAAVLWATATSLTLVGLVARGLHRTPAIAATSTLRPGEERE